MLAGLTPSVGSVGNTLDNALEETTIGLYKPSACARAPPVRRGPPATLADTEEATSAWVHWYNNERPCTDSAVSHRAGHTN
jgi:putative transposase